MMYTSENKRKGDEAVENPHAKTKCLEKQRCSDLIVLGLPWKSTEDDLRRYFAGFGDLLLVQVGDRTSTENRPVFNCGILHQHVAPG